jgi:hypothetical protein
MPCGEAARGTELSSQNKKRLRRELSRTDTSPVGIMEKKKDIFQVQGHIFQRAVMGIYSGFYVLCSASF